MTTHEALVHMQNLWAVKAPGDTTGQIRELTLRKDRTIWAGIVETDGRVHYFPCSQLEETQ